MFKSKSSEVNSVLKDAFSKIKKEFDSHLDSINENTNEIQANYEFLCELDMKIDKLNERIDELQYLFDKSPDKKTKQKQVGSIKLTMQEQEVFLMLYTLADEETLSFSDLGKRTGYSQRSVREHVLNLNTKGVVIRRVRVDGLVRLFMDREFKNNQAKYNVVKISEKLVKYLDF